MKAPRAPTAAEHVRRVCSAGAPRAPRARAHPEHTRCVTGAHPVYARGMHRAAPPHPSRGRVSRGRVGSAGETRVRGDEGALQLGEQLPEGVAGAVDRLRHRRGDGLAVEGAVARCADDAPHQGGVEALRRDHRVTAYELHGRDRLTRRQGRGASRRGGDVSRGVDVKRAPRGESRVGVHVPLDGPRQHRHRGRSTEVHRAALGLRRVDVIRDVHPVAPRTVARGPGVGCVRAGVDGRARVGGGVPRGCSTRGDDRRNAR